MSDKSQPPRDDDDWSDDSEDERHVMDADEDDDEVLDLCGGETAGLLAASDRTFPSPSACLEQAKREQGLDVRLLERRLRLDCFGAIRMVNFLRSAEGSTMAATEVMALTSAELWQDQKYMKPVIEDDPLLMLDFEDEELVEPGRTDQNDAQQVLRGGDDVDLKELQAELSRLRLALEEKESALGRALQTMGSMREVMRRNVLGNDDDGDQTGELKPVAEAKTMAEDQSYAKGYAHFGIHHEMLSDRPRTLSYREAIEGNANCLIRGGRVLDVGCGTGILSLFCARAGARSVVAVDMSDIIEQAHDIRRENGFDHVIDLKKGRLEEVGLDGGDKFDAVVSEWMGYFLLYEGMLDTVLYARDHFLKPGGRLLPNRCTMYLTALEDKERYAEYVHFWNDVYGFKMSCMKQPVLKEAAVETVDPKTIVSRSAARIHHLDLESCSLRDTEFSSSFELCADRDAEITSLAGSFDCTFDLPDKTTTLSTSPASPPTHWKQTVFYLRHPLPVKAGEVVRGHIEVTRPKEDPRALSIDIDIAGNKQKFVME